MEIILALIALEASLIRTELFVALVVMALVTSLLASPMLHRLLRARPRGDVRSLLEEGAVLLDLRARSAEQAVRELAADLAAARSLDGSVMADAVLEFGTDLGGLQDGVALPMARIQGLPATMLAFGRSDRGLDFNAVDGKPAHLVFLLLVPESAVADATEVQAAVVRLVETGAQRQLLLGATSRSELLDAIHRATALATPLPVPSPVSPPLAGSALVRCAAGGWLFAGCSLRGWFGGRCAAGSVVAGCLLCNDARGNAAPRAPGGRGGGAVPAPRPLHPLPQDAALGMRLYRASRAVPETPYRPPTRCASGAPPHPLRGRGPWPKLSLLGARKRCSRLVHFC
jgi:mannitol/fructose-specific phosphotransferase system IIA component (Ntr-type)